MSEKQISIHVSPGTGKRWSNQEMLLLYHLKTAGKSYSQIAEIMNTSIGARDYSENLCYKKWQQTPWDSFLSEMGDIESQLEQLEGKEFEKQKVIESTLANQERLTRREQARTELIIESIKSSIYRLPKPKAADLTFKPKHQTSYSEEHVGIVLSDLHIGASYSKEDTGGLSEFNPDIFHRRLQVMKRAVLDICERHANVYELPELHIFCLGDIVAGMNDAGAWSSNYIDLDIYDQMIQGVAALRDVIATWSLAFGKVHFYGIYGNHGRIGKRGAQKDSTNWDRITYEIVKTSMSEYENIEWHIPKSWWLMVNIQDHNFYLTHGDGIRGSMGIPFYGVERAERSIVGMMDEKPDYMLIGHFHSPAEIQTNSSRIIMNGSFMGGDMYSLRELRRCDKPEQKMFGIHKTKGVTWTYNLHLDEE